MMRMLPWGIIIIAATLAFYCNSQANNVKYNTRRIESQLTETKQKIGQYDDLNNNFGRGSSIFYAAKPIIFLKAGGNPAPISIYWEKADNNVTALASSRNISGKWGKWNGKWIDLTVTPSKNAGYYSVHFSNKINSDAFDVLVVVK